MVKFLYILCRCFGVCDVFQNRCFYLQVVNKMLHLLHSILYSICLACPALSEMHRIIAFMVHMWPPEIFNFWLLRSQLELVNLKELGVQNPKAGLPATRVRYLWDFFQKLGSQTASVLMSKDKFHNQFWKYYSQCLCSPAYLQ